MVLRRFYAYGKVCRLRLQTDYLGSSEEITIAFTGRCTKSRTKLAVSPRITIGISKESRIRNSLRLRSVNSEMYVVFRVPNATRLNSQVEYTAPKTIPAVENNSTALFPAKIPRKTSSSPRKLDVPGKLMFARVNAKNILQNRGITVTTPP